MLVKSGLGNTTHVLSTAPCYPAITDVTETRMTYDEVGKPLVRFCIPPVHNKNLDGAILYASTDQVSDTLANIANTLADCLLHQFEEGSSVQPFELDYCPLPPSPPEEEPKLWPLSMAGILSLLVCAGFIWCVCTKKGRSSAVSATSGAASVASYAASEGSRVMTEIREEESRRDRETQRRERAENDYARRNGQRLPYPWL